jgi:hypothetical protein
MAYVLGAVERAMKVRDVILQALAGKLTWIQAADILGRSARSIRRLRLKFERYGVDELYAALPQAGAGGRGAATAHLADVEALIVLPVPLSPDRAPQARGALRLCLREEGAPRRRARRQTPPARPASAPPGAPALLRRATASGRQPASVAGAGSRAVVHTDRRGGRRHQAAPLRPALPGGGESVSAVMTALRAVLQRYGLPMACIPTARPIGRCTRRWPAAVGRALARLGIEHILGYSPQARGRSERANRTLQGRFVNELRVAGPPSPSPTATCVSTSSPTSMPNSPAPQPHPPRRSCPWAAPESLTYGSWCHLALHKSLSGNPRHSTQSRPGAMLGRLWL